MAKKPDQDEPEHLPAPPPAPPPEAAPLPSLTWDAYVDLRRQLEIQLQALAARWASSVLWPRWLYHATQLPRIVASKAEADALGPGWHVTPD